MQGTTNLSKKEGRDLGHLKTLAVFVNASVWNGLGAFRETKGVHEFPGSLRLGAIGIYQCPLV